MLLKNLLENVKVIKLQGNENLECNDIAINSKLVTDKSLFICLKGNKFDGSAFVNEAIENGANVIVCEKEIVCDATCVVVENARKALSSIASNFYGKPSNLMRIISVVGTNGKSTTAYIIYNLLKNYGIKAGLIGTMYVEYDGIRKESTMTTPDPIELNCMFKDMCQVGVRYVVMEVSAHAIFYQKLYGIKSFVKVFTNFSQDHLDFFKNMDDYRKCKQSFFLEKDNSIHVINMDDNLGVELIKKSKNETITYGLSNPSDVFCIDIENKSDGSGYILNLFDSIMDISSKFFGRFNVYNTMAAAIVAKLCGVKDYSIEQTLSLLKPPEGRFNVFEINKVKYIVDFAHTPDGLFNLLKEAKKISRGKMITIFGCGGDRDTSKRAIMGRIAKNMSDIVILTSDNPRTEKKEAIIEDILQGITNKDNLLIEVDRKKAIALGSKIANEGDIVLIAGKGSESYIEENNTFIPYSDIQEVSNLSV